MQQLGLPPMEVVIHYGRTEEAIIEELRAHGLKLYGVPDGSDEGSGDRD